jgi:FixJ family two-component response regulator
MAAIARTLDVEFDAFVATPTIERPGRTMSTIGTSAATEPDSTSSAAPTVFVVNDDASLLEALGRLIRSIGWEARTFGSALDFLARPVLPTPSCLVLDVAMSEIDGLELQERMAVACPETPVVFVTGVADVATSVRAMKRGAVDFLVRPFREEALVNAIALALKRSRAARQRRLQTEELRDCYASLSSREREVMALVVGGRLNKQVAADLGISEITVKAHRGSLMRKMKADSLPDLVTMAVVLGLSIPSSGRSSEVQRHTACVRSLARPRLRWQQLPMPSAWAYEGIADTKV